MLKIGDFSRLSQISIKALRHYDNLGLLQPEHIDRFTNYRYYTLNQLPRAHRIMALKEMGLSLEQIGIILNDDINPDEIRGMFRLKKAEIEQAVRDQQKQLAMVEFHLRMIELENQMPELNVVVKEIPEYKALYLRFHPVEHQIPTLAQEISRRIENGDIKYGGLWIGAVYGEEFNTGNYDFAFIITVTDEQTADIGLSPNETLKLTTMPAAVAATLVVEGHGEPDLLEKQVLLDRWGIENGYGLCHEYRAIHHKGPMHGLPQSEWVTELQVILQPPTDTHDQ